MHIVLMLLTAVVTVVILLKRLADAGIDLGGLNPFARGAGGIAGQSPDGLAEPMSLAALLVVATARCDGGIGVDEKREVLRAFEEEFRLSRQDAAGLLAASVHWLTRLDDVCEQLEDLMRPSQDKFSEEQATSTLALMKRVAKVDGAPSSRQNELIEVATTSFARRFPTVQS